MKISNLYMNKKPVISFEIFPPKLDTPVESIYDKLESFSMLKPDFISVTYGAGGSKKDRTIEIASKIKNTYGIESLAHFTCVGHSLEDIDSMLEKMKASSIKNVLALRGDRPKDMPDFDFNKNTFSHASQLVSYIRQKSEICIGAAAYPEGHVSSPKIKFDMHFLKQKVEMGTDFLITQLFFDNRVFYDFMDKCIQMNIDCPISAGIMPIFKVDQIKTIASLCGASMPAALILELDKYKDNPDDLLKAGIEYAANQISGLIRNGVDGVHICTMNRPSSTREIMRQAGLL